MTQDAVIQDGDLIERLRECPHCGNANAPKVAPWPIPDQLPGYYVVCSAYGWDDMPGRGCGCSSAWGATPEEAIAAWNRRADSGSALAPDTAELVKRLLARRLLSKAEPEMYVGEFAERLMSDAASALTALSATVEQLRKELEAMTIDRDETLRAATGMSAEVNAFADRAEDAERQLSEARKALEARLAKLEALFDQGKGEHGTPSYVTDHTWLHWSGEAIGIREALHALSLREEE